MQLGTIAKDRQNFLGRFCAGQALAHRAVIQKLCNGGERAQMRLKLILRHNKKDDEFHWSIIERIKLNAGSRPSECSNDFVESIRRTMWNGNAEPDSCTHRFLALSKRAKNGVAIRRFDFAKTNKQINQLDDCRPALRCFHLWD